MKIIFLPARGKPKLRDIPNTIQACHEQIGEKITVGAIYFDDDLVAVAVDEDGYLKGKKRNKHLGKLNKAGDAFICGLDGADLTDIPDSVIKLFKLEV